MTVHMRSAANSTPVTATVNPAPAVETGFGDLDGTLRSIQQAAPTVNTVADTGEPEDTGIDLDTRAAALLPDKPVTDWNAVSAFMAHVVSWPASPQDPGYVNLHCSSVDRNDPKKFYKGGGWPFRSVADFIGRASWINTTTRFKDAWFCLSLQSEVKPNPKNPQKPKAHRLAANALLVKALWIDADVGPGKQHATVEDALKALILFREKYGLPQYSALVGSGSGLHAYWISKTALTVKEWAPYAEGLRALLLADKVVDDPGITTDVARILRVPGTFNHKTTPPKPILLLNLPLAMHDFAADLAVLPTVAPATSTIRGASAPAHSLFVAAADGGNPNSFKNKPILAASPDDTLQAGIDKHEDVLLKAEPIFKQCGFYKEALLTGGRDYDNALWMYSVLGATFMENGNKIAHKISSGHSTYSPADTQAMFDRKVAERADGRVGGYPQCATIAGAGCEACKTCPLLGNIRSPLNIRPAFTATVTGTSSTSGSSGHASWTGRPGISFSNIPHRKWLYGFDLVRGELTVIGSPGGAGKSSLAIGMAICVATNRELLGEKIRGGAGLKALVINGEDSTDEIRRRVHAFCLAHSVDERDLIDLTIAGADDAWVQRISFLTTNERGMSALNQGGLDALQLALDALHPDVIVLDPLVSFCAGGNMNDNSVMSSVMRKLKEIAARNQCAVIIVHHTRKGGDAGNVETISGAAAITNLARRAIMPAPLTDDDIKRLGILPSERYQYFKLVDAKSNLVPRAGDSPLYRLLGVELPNPEPPLYPNGDNVQAITRVVLPIQPSGVANADDVKIEAAILEVVDRGKVIDGQPYPYSPSPAGAQNERPLLSDAMAAVANATAPRQWHPGDLKAVTDAAIKKMKADGRLVVGAMKDLMPNPGRFRKSSGLKAVPI